MVFTRSSPLSAHFFPRLTQNALRAGLYQTPDASVGNGKREIGNFQFDSNSFNRFLPPIPPFRQGQESVFQVSKPAKSLGRKKKISIR